MEQRLGRFLVAFVCCEVTFLGSTALGLWVKDLPFDYDRWGGGIIAAIMLVPQAYVVGYLAWMAIRRWVLRTKKIEGLVSGGLILGGVLGVIFYSLGGGIKWLIPWMILLVRL